MCAMSHQLVLGIERGPQTSEDKEGEGKEGKKSGRGRKEDRVGYGGGKKRSEGGIESR